MVRVGGYFPNTHSIVRARRAARRRVARGRGGEPLAFRAQGRHRHRHHGLGIVAMLSGLLGDAGIQFVGIGVFMVFIGVFVLGPVIARPGQPMASVRRCRGCGA